MTEHKDTDRRPPRWRGRLILLAVILVAGAMFLRSRGDAGDLDEILPFIAEGGISLLLGILMGTVSRKILRMAILVLVVIFVGLQVLAYKQILVMDWPVVQEAFNITPDGDLEQILREKVPVGGTFLLGYFIGLVKN